MHENAPTSFYFSTVKLTKHVVPRCFLTTETALKCMRMTVRASNQKFFLGWTPGPTSKGRGKGKVGRGHPYRFSTPPTFKS